VTPSGGPQLGKSAGPQRGNPADEYIEALIIGLNRQKDLKAEQRAANLLRTRELLEGGGTAPPGANSGA
jgi:hypothetical protein